MSTLPRGNDASLSFRIVNRKTFTDWRKLGFRFGTRSLGYDNNVAGRVVRFLPQSRRGYEATGLSFQYIEDIVSSRDHELKDDEGGMNTQSAKVQRVYKD